MPKRYDNILETIGNTPVVRIHKLAPDGVEVYGKIEAFNPMGSVKDRLAHPFFAVIGKNQFELGLQLVAQQIADIPVVFHAEDQGPVTLRHGEIRRFRGALFRPGKT